MITNSRFISRVIRIYTTVAGSVAQEPRGLDPRRRQESCTLILIQLFISIFIIF